MSRKATEFQKKEMSRMYRGKEIFKPLNTGWIDENVACVREWVANIFFYRKGDTTIMIDAGYNYDRLAEKMGWLGIDPQSIRHILITHQDTDHVGAVEADSPGLFRNAKLYIGEDENRYLTGEVRRRVIYHLYKLPQVTIRNEKVLLRDGQVFDIDGIRIECFLVPGHTWGHMVYLIDGRYYAVCGDVTSFREIEELEENLILPAFRKLSGFVDCNKPFFRRLMHKAFLRAKKGCDQWHDYEMRVAPFDKDKPIYYEFAACPAAEFAKKHGLEAIMPALCNVDYASMELLHARLVRTSTCVDGCRCDYTICGDRDPYGSLRRQLADSLTEQPFPPPPCGPPTAIRIRGTWTSLSIRTAAGTRGGSPAAASVSS